MSSGGESGTGSLGGPGAKSSSLNFPSLAQTWNLFSLCSLWKWQGSWLEGAKGVATLEGELAAHFLEDGSKDGTGPSGSPGEHSRDSCLFPCSLLEQEQLPFWPNQAPNSEHLLSTY